MANETIGGFRAVHGMDPQHLIPQITRTKIYDSVYWKEKCFGLTAETFMDRAVELKYVGGTYGGISKPTHFLCLLLKLLQLQPEDDIIDWLLDQEDFKYLRALAAFYIRLTAKAPEVYKKLEPHYADYRKLSVRTAQSWELLCIDQFVDSLLRDERCCDITLPYMTKRTALEKLGMPRRQSTLDGEGESEGEGEGNGAQKQPAANDRKRGRSETSNSGGTKKRRGAGSGSDSDSDSDSDANAVTAPEGSTEYWNQMRAKMGMKPLTQ